MIVNLFKKFLKKQERFMDIDNLMYRNTPINVFSL